MLRSNAECAKCVEEICKRAAPKLTEWESNFIDKLFGQTTFSYKQREVIDKIYRQRVG